jgi:hypothetical protein
MLFLPQAGSCWNCIDIPQEGSMRSGTSVRLLFGRLLFGRLLVVLALVPAAGLARASAHEAGVVVLHGTQGMPGTMVTARFEAALRAAGYLVQAPAMCWSRNRIHDAPSPDGLRDIDSAIARLRAAGARRIAVAGQSEAATRR